MVDAYAPRHRASLAIGHRRAGQTLDLEGDVLDDMAEPGALLALFILFAQPADEAARHAVRAAVILERRHQRDEPIVELRQFARGIGLQLLQVHRHTNDRPVAIWVWAAVDAGFENAHGSLLAKSVARLYHTLALFQQ